MSRAPARTVLLVEARPAGTDVLAADLNRLGGVKVVRVRTLDAALDTLATMPVDAVVGVHQPPDLEGLVLLRTLHSEDQRQDPATVLLAEQDAATIRIAAWREGVDAILTWPADPVDVAGALMVLMERRAAARSHSSRISGPDDSIRRLVGLLATTLDAAIPGARSRGEAVAQAAVTVANAIDVPSDLLLPMEYAARLHEIGRIGTTADPSPGSGYGLSSEVTLAGSAMLGEIPALADAAMLLEGMGANWDGSGHPPTCSRGRSRCGPESSGPATTCSRRRTAPPGAAPGGSQRPWRRWASMPAPGTTRLCWRRWRCSSPRRWTPAGSVVRSWCRRPGSARG
ncbi:MAG: hypothetical protein IPO52_06965 [Gemmatimonadetes bacterium]|nr:hypothetical protein [Gemmatimonadota bacterium]